MYDSKKKYQVKFLIETCIFLIVFLFTNNIIAQNGIYSRYKKYIPKEKIILHNRDTTIEAGLIFTDKMRPIKSKMYFWYKQQNIRTNFGAYDGNLLHGVYKKFSPSHNLVEKGNFKFGLKNSFWYKWDEKGNLIEVSKWKKGFCKSIVYPTIKDQDKSKKQQQKYSHLFNFINRKSIQSDTSKSHKVRTKSDTTRKSTPKTHTKPILPPPFK